MPRKKMPQHIKENFVYRKVWSDVYYKDQNAIFLFIGDVGTGKSTGGLLFGENLDENFSLERVCFSTSELFDLIQKGDSHGKLKPGSVIIFDEAAGSEDAVDARNSLSKPNKILSFFSTISRAKRYIIIYIAPFFSQFDKRIRMIGVTGIVVFKGIDLKRKLSRANFHWSYGLPFSDRTLIPKPRLISEKGEKYTVDRILLPKPSASLIKEYKIKKNKFIDGKIGDWRKQLVEIKEKKRDSHRGSFKRTFDSAKRNIEALIDEKGNVSKGKLRLMYSMDDRTAVAIKKLLEAEMS